LVHLQRDLHIDCERFQKEFIFGPFVQQVIIGRVDLKEALTEHLPSLGFHGDPQIVLDYWLRNDARLNTELLQKVQILKRSAQVRLFIATNQEHHRAHYLMNDLKLGEYFEEIFCSARIGHLKPTAEFFSHVAAALELSDKAS
jgi:putative hydrolase of the HAD superfamily